MSECVAAAVGLNRSAPKSGAIAAAAAADDEDDHDDNAALCCISANRDGRRFSWRSGQKDEDGDERRKNEFSPLLIRPAGQRQSISIAL